MAKTLTNGMGGPKDTSNYAGGPAPVRIGTDVSTAETNPMGGPVDASKFLNTPSNESVADATISPVGGGKVVPTPVGGAGTNPPPPPNTGATATNANQVISDWLTSIGLGSIAPQVFAWSAKGYSPAVLLSMIKSDPSTAPAYQARFPALAQLQKTNPAMTEGDYIAKENADRGLLYQYLGPAAKAFDNTNSLGNIMTQLIGTNELQSRLQAIHDEANASADTKAWMKNTYGLSDQDVAAAWLDPKLTADQVALRDTASQIGGAGVTSGFGTLTQAQAEALAQNGVTQSQAQNTFAKIGNYGQLEQTLPGNDSGSISQDDLLNGAFNGGAAGAELSQLQGARVAQFQEGGGMQADSSGVTGDRSAATL